MSGGSFNYLCYADVRDLFDKIEDMIRMADSMTARGAHDAAAELEFILADMAAFRRRTEVRWDRLSDIMRAIEWHESGDSSEDRVTQALTAYRGLTPATSSTDDGSAPKDDGATESTAKPPHQSSEGGRS